jgi:transposase-like protein
MERRRFTREFKLEAVRLIRDRGVSYAQASEDLKVHPTQLRNWVKAFADDPQHAFPGGQMKPEQLEIARLKREVIKLKAERDIKIEQGCLLAFMRAFTVSYETRTRNVPGSIHAC